MKDSMDRQQREVVAELLEGPEALLGRLVEEERAQVAREWEEAQGCEAGLALSDHDMPSAPLAKEMERACYDVRRAIAMLRR